MRLLTSRSGVRASLGAISDFVRARIAPSCASLSGAPVRRQQPRVCSASDCSECSPRSDSVRRSFRAARAATAFSNDEIKRCVSLSALERRRRRKGRQGDDAPPKEESGARAIVRRARGMKEMRPLYHTARRACGAEGGEVSRRREEGERGSERGGLGAALGAPRHRPPPLLTQSRTWGSVQHGLAQPVRRRSGSGPKIASRSERC